jgi:hypothetical protein
MENNHLCYLELVMELELGHDEEDIIIKKAVGLYLLVYVHLLAPRKILVW